MIKKVYYFNLISTVVANGLFFSTMPLVQLHFMKLMSESYYAAGTFISSLAAIIVLSKSDTNAQRAFLSKHINSILIIDVTLYVLLTIFGMYYFNDTLYASIRYIIIVVSNAITPEIFNVVDMSYTNKIFSGNKLTWWNIKLKKMGETSILFGAGFGIIVTMIKPNPIILLFIQAVLNVWFVGFQIYIIRMLKEICNDRILLKSAI